MRSIIYIDKEGNLRGLADDQIDRICSLGPKIVERVSNIEFDHTEQVWIATDLLGNVIARDPIRGKVIELEREYLNRKIEEEFSLAH